MEISLFEVPSKSIWQSLVYKLEEMGVNLDFKEDGIQVSAEGDLKPVDVKHYHIQVSQLICNPNDGFITYSKWA